MVLVISLALSSGSVFKAAERIQHIRCNWLVRSINVPLSAKNQPGKTCVQQNQQFVPMPIPRWQKPLVENPQTEPRSQVRCRASECSVGRRAGKGITMRRFSSLFCLLLVSGQLLASDKVTAVYPEEQLSSPTSSVRPAGMSEYLATVIDEPDSKTACAEEKAQPCEGVCNHPAPEHRCSDRACDTPVMATDRMHTIGDRVLQTLKCIPGHFSRDNRFEGTRSWSEVRARNCCPPPIRIECQGMIGVTTPAEVQCGDKTGCTAGQEMPPRIQDEADDSSGMPLWPPLRGESDTDGEASPAHGAHSTLPEVYDDGRAPNITPGSPGAEYVEPPAWNGKRHRQEPASGHRQI